MRVKFDARKTAQAACQLIQLNDGTMNYMVLVKLLYLADRRALIETGVPVTGDRMVAMPHGPVLSQTLDQINMGEPAPMDEASVWYEYITEPSDYTLSIKKVPRERTLEEHEINLIWPALEGLGYPFGPWAQLLLLLGQRRSEVATIERKPGELDLDKAQWIIPAHKNKPATVPLYFLYNLNYPYISLNLLNN